MGLRRRQDWPERLLEAINAKADTRFSPGIHDCCISACDIVLHMTGVDVAAKVRGYKGKEEMRAVLNEHGGVEATVESAMKENSCGEILVSLAGRGDFVLLDMADGPTLAVVDTDGINAIACGTKGWERVNIKAHAKRAWEVD
ncbi:hypothetical protein LCGC14_1488600 [marine sediment metagenome]|uniref:DUF6950 domain-containing protein n=1 Tax=marine sediment metagenome TaxID=412755 RepID=A0A0F9M992_9ZZZZ